MAINNRSGACSPLGGALKTATARAGGLAVNPDGSLALMPHDLAHELSHELGNLMALLEAVHAVAADDRPDGLIHSKETRLKALVSIAEEKLLVSINRMQPYV